MHSIKWMAFARLSAQLLRWAATLLVIRFLEPSDFGIVALSEPVIGFLEIFATMGLGAAIIRSPAITQVQLRSIFTFILMVNAFLFLVLFLGSSYIADFFNREELSLVLKVLSFGFLMTSMEMIPTTLLAKEMKFKQLALIHLLAGIVGALTSLTLALSGFGYWALVLGGMSIQATRVLVVALVRPVFLLPTRRLANALGFAHFGGYVLGANIVWFLYVSLDVVIAGKYWDPELLGLYAVALNLAAMPLSKIMPTIKQIGLPAYSRAQEDPEVSQYYLLKSLRLGMGVGMPFFFGLASISVLLVPLLLDTKWAAAAAPLTLLFLTMPFRMFLELHEPAVTARGGPQLIFRNSLVILAVMVPAYFYAVMRFDPAALAAAWLAVFPILALASSSVYCRFLGISYTRLLRSVAPAFFVSVAMFVVVQALIYIMEPVSPVATLVIAIASGAVFYFAVMSVADRTMLMEYRALFKR